LTSIGSPSTRLVMKVIIPVATLIIFAFLYHQMCYVINFNMKYNMSLEYIVLLCCVFVLFVFVLWTLCCMFLCVVHFVLPRQCSLTFMNMNFPC
jgi:hypothetical protein